MDKMKKCPSCGALQSADRTTCVDCGRVLPAASEEAAMEAQETVNDAAGNDRPMPKWARPAAIAAICLAPFEIALCLIFCQDRFWGCLLAAVLAVLAGLSILDPDVGCYLGTPRGARLYREQYIEEHGVVKTCLNSFWFNLTFSVILIVAALSIR